MFLSFVSEGELNLVVYVEEETEYNPPTTDDATDIIYDEVRPNENIAMPTDIHPFVAALKEYMADSEGVVRAYFATLDDYGTMGVLITTRLNTMVLFDYDAREYIYGGSGTVLYIQDGELLQIDAPGFVSGRYNRLVQRLHAHTHLVEIIYKLEYGRWETSTRLEYFCDEYLLVLLGDDDAATESIAERDARAKYARERYGLVALLPPNFGHMRNTQDQTAQILAMTINCMPSLDTTATITQTDQISIIIGDIPISFAVGQPISVDGHVLAPAHELFDLLGFLVTQQLHTQQVRILGNAGCIVIILNSDVLIRNYYWNRRYYTLDVPTQIIDGITMVPIRAVLENIGYDVQWDEDAQTVIITNSN